MEKYTLFMVDRPDVAINNYCRKAPLFVYNKGSLVLVLVVNLLWLCEQLNITLGIPSNS
jgi:hypothetical protein